jgi:hypothetical protein
MPPSIKNTPKSVYKRMPFVKEKKRGEFLEKRFVDFRITGLKVKKLDMQVMMPSVFYCWSAGVVGECSQYC